MTEKVSRMAKFGPARFLIASELIRFKVGVISTNINDSKQIEYRQLFLLLIAYTNSPIYQNILHFPMNQQFRLFQKIEKLIQVLQESKQAINKEHKLPYNIKLCEVVDATLYDLNNLDHKLHYQEEVKKLNLGYSQEQKTLDKAKVLTQQKIIKLQYKEKQLEKTKLETEILQLSLSKDKIIKQSAQKEASLQYQLLEWKKKSIHYERELQEVINKNRLLLQMAETAKKERDDAETKFYQLEAIHHPNQPFESAFSNKESMIKIKKILTHTGQKKNKSKIYNISENQCSFALRMPARIEVQKIVYGIQLGYQKFKGQIQFLSEVPLYEKDIMSLQVVEGHLRINYEKRRQKVALSNHKFSGQELVVFLHGCGDSICILEEC